MPIVDVSGEDWRIPPTEVERLAAEPVSVRLRLGRARRRFWQRPYGEDETGPALPQADEPSTPSSPRQR